MVGFSSKRRPAISAACLFVFAFLMSFSCIAQAAPDNPFEESSSENTASEDNSSENIPDTGFNPDGTYHAALGLQTSPRIHMERFGYFSENPGGVYCPYGEENWNKLTCTLEKKHKNKKRKKSGKKSKNSDDTQKQTTERIVVPGEFTDAEIKGNGTYSVTLEHADFQKENTLSLLQLTTDIPLNSEVTISDIHVTINKRTLVTFEEAFLEDDESYLSGGMTVLLLSHQQYGLKGRLSRLGHPETSPDGWEVLRGGKDECITVTFNISGFNYDNENAMPKPKNNFKLRKIIGSDSPDNPAKENERGGISIVAVVGCVLVILAALITGIVIRKRKIVS